MNKKSYDCFFEVAGPTAMFTRPASGAGFVTYPVPTQSAVKGMFEAILRLKEVEISPTKVEICSPLIYHNYTTNYGGPLRKSSQIAGGILTNCSPQSSSTFAIEFMRSPSPSP
jgi:CRISPR-associated protein Cas5d